MRSVANIPLTIESAKYATTAIQDRVSLYSSSSNISLSGVKPLKRFYPQTKPISFTANENRTNSILECTPLETDGKGNFVDKDGRKITLKGMNLDGSMKLPIGVPSHVGGGETDNIFFDGDNVTFVGRPFPLEEAQSHFQRIKSWGFNTIRYLLTWEAIEHEGPGKYDQDFIDYTIKILSILHEVGGLYVILEFHQDVWSRYSGGSGAPMWTLLAAGLQPRRFAVTEAAILFNESRFHDDDDPEHYHKMLWTSNYKRLAAMTMFTLFYGGSNYFPDLTINGVNIQDFLQDHFFKATEVIWKAVNEKLPEMLMDGTIVGFESMNEPNCGLFGHENLGGIPGNQQLRVGTTPTAFESMKLGMGFACRVDEYKIAITGPQKFATRVVDPKGQRAWLSVEEAAEIDKKYNWKRGTNWKVGECIYAQEGIWKWKDDFDFKKFPLLTEEERLQLTESSCELLNGHYFNQVQDRHNLTTFHGQTPEKIDLDYFINNNFVDFYLRFKKTIRDVNPDVFVFIQPPVLEIPPAIKDDKRNIIDSKTVYCPHYYDGMSLMFKCWNTKYNVDTLGIMRGKYINPVLGIVFGERAIKNCIKKQFKEIKEECYKYLGTIPVLMSETGMPFDMDDKKAYKSKKYYSQTAALDSICGAIEGANLNVTYWCYTSINCHKWGDNWNNEDFSFWSADDRNLDIFDNDTDVDSEVSTLTSSSPSLVSSIYNARSTIKSTLRQVRSRRIEAMSLVRSKLYGREPVTALPATKKDSRLPKRNRNGYASDMQVSESDTDNMYNDDFLVSKVLNGKAERERLLSSEQSTTCEESTPFEKSSSQESDLESLTQSLQSSCLISTSTDNLQLKHARKCYPSPDGVRAAGAVFRPSVIATKGDIEVQEFDFNCLKYGLSLTINSDDRDLVNIPTIIYVPKWHYPFLSYKDIFLTSGHVKYNDELEYLEWYHTSETAGDDVPPDEQFVREEKGITKETLIIKNFSGKLDEARLIEERGLFPCAGELSCPIQ
ncbi:glycoside hydrolase [Scheffersomyces xylosifermentans]|uniref:glycoside hydrolase n=1 Tax=Scheffersomyces xylosifermentans TaxID=1304137 RepID=UPI00315D2636